MKKVEDQCANETRWEDDRIRDATPCLFWFIGFLAFFLRAGGAFKTTTSATQLTTCSWRIFKPRTNTAKLRQRNQLSMTNRTAIAIYF